MMLFRRFAVVAAVALALLALAVLVSARTPVYGARAVMQRPLRATPMVKRAGSHAVCSPLGKHVRLTYDTVGAADNAFVQLDNIAGLLQLQCDVDHTALLLTFVDATARELFVAQLQYQDMFITGGGKYGCAVSASARGGASGSSSTNSTDNFVLRRLLGASTLYDTSVELHAVIARYDEIYQQADISYDTEGECDPSATMTEYTKPVNADKTICLGVNSDSTCDHASAPISIFSNQYMTLSCSNCFLGFTSDVFFTMQIRWFKLVNLAGGFKNTNLNGALVFDWQAHAQWSAGVDKTLPIVPETTILSFKIGPIPFRLWFEIPLRIYGQASFDVEAEVTVGATMDWNLGDNYIQYTDKTRWQHIHSTPSFTYTPQLSVAASVNAQGSFALIPSLQLHVDNVYSYTMTFTPQLDASLTGSLSSHQVCAELDYEVSLVSEAELNINIDWLHIHEDKVWGPNTLWDTGKQPIAKKCVNF